MYSALLEDMGPVLASGESRERQRGCGYSSLEGGKAHWAEPQKLVSRFILKIIFAFRVTPQFGSLQHHARAMTLSSPSDEQLS